MSYNSSGRVVSVRNFLLSDDICLLWLTRRGICGIIMLTVEEIEEVRSDPLGISRNQTVTIFEFSSYSFDMPGPERIM